MPSELTKLKSWSPVQQARLMRGSSQSAFRCYLYLDLSGALLQLTCCRWLCHGVQLWLLLGRCCVLPSEKGLLAAPCAGVTAQLAVTEAVECNPPRHPDQLPLAELAERASGHWWPLTVRR